MVRAIALTVCSLLVSAIGVSAAPTGNNSTVNTLQMTVNEILDAPIAAANLQILHLSPSTPALTAQLLPPFLTLTPQSSTCQQSRLPFPLRLPQQPLPSLLLLILRREILNLGGTWRREESHQLLFNMYWDIDSTPHPSYPEVNYNQWVAAISKGCRSFFDPVNPPTSPLVYLYEGSFDSRPVGPLSHPFTFSYHVRSNPSTPYDAYYAYSADKCIAELKIRMYICMAPDSNGWMTALGSCWDSTGFTSFPDGNSPIWWTITSPTH